MITAAVMPADCNGDGHAATSRVRACLPVTPIAEVPVIQLFATCCFLVVTDPVAQRFDLVSCIGQGRCSVVAVMTVKRITDIQPAQRRNTETEDRYRYQYADQGRST